MTIKDYRRLSSLRIVFKESWLSKIIPWYEMTHFLIHSFSQTWKLDRESFLAASRVVEERLPFLITFFWLGLLVGYHSFLRDCFMMVAIFHLSFIILFASCLADQHAWSYNRDRASSKELKQCCHKQHASLTELTHFLMGPASHSSKWGSQKEHKHLPSTAAKTNNLIHFLTYRSLEMLVSLWWVYDECTMSVW